MERVALKCPDDCVHCWVIPLACPPVGDDKLLALLSADEQSNAQRRRVDHDKTRYVRAHAALRSILAQYLRISPREIDLASDARGRPALVKNLHALHFNLSRSDDLALVAIATQTMVGVDVERVRRIADVLRMAHDHFTPDEANHLAGIKAKDRLAAFFVTWTRKEAVIKALGLGFDRALNSFGVGAPDGPPALTFSGNGGSHWTLIDLNPAEGYRAAIAVPLPKASVHLREASWEWMLDV